jgi:hypothetical protein
MHTPRHCDLIMQIDTIYYNPNRVFVQQDDFAITPRRKSGQACGEADRAPVVLSRELLESYFCMSLNAASRELVSILICT